MAEEERIYQSMMSNEALNNTNEISILSGGSKSIVNQHQVSYN
jgi:hypothetical protein